MLVPAPMIALVVALMTMTILRRAGLSDPEQTDSDPECCWSWMML